ncbi:hypothetical protein D3C87_176400 [compost metagenome]
MDKISGILPPSARTRTADISNSQPARPGAPTFGRVMGKSSLSDRVTLSKMAEQMIESGGPALQETPPGVYKNTPENSKLKVIEDLNKKFFARPDKTESTETLSEQTLGRYNNSVDFKETVPVAETPVRSGTLDLQES